MERTYTVKQAAAALGVAKSTILRHLDELPAEMTAQGQYRGQPTKLTNEAGIRRLASLLSVAEVNYAALNEAERSAPSAQISDASEAKQGIAEQAELIAELRARIAAQDEEIRAKNAQITSLTNALEKAQDATATAQALHAATYDRLRQLEAHQEPQEAPQDEPHPEQTTSTTPAQEAPEAAPSAPTEAPAPEITRKATFAERLRILFTGRN